MIGQADVDEAIAAELHGRGLEFQPWYGFTPEPHDRPDDLAAFLCKDTVAVGRVLEVLEEHRVAFADSPIYLMTEETTVDPWPDHY